MCDLRYTICIGKVESIFTRGKDAILLTDKDGLEYLVGTQRPEELFELIKKELEK